MNRLQIPPVTYDMPPLVEVAMSIQFDPPKGLNQAHLGAFWATQRHAFRNVRTVQPIATANEVFGGHGQWLPPSLQLSLTNEPDCRLQMTSDDDQWMCQVQRDRLVVNWRKRSDQYPRFSVTWERFQQAWMEWLGFIKDVEVGPLRLRLWEVTYVNRIPKGALWSCPSDWPTIFPGLWGGSFAQVENSDLRGFQGQWVWEASNPPSRLYVEPKPGRSADDPTLEVLLLSLTGRGPVGSNEAATTDDAASTIELIEAGIRSGHDLVVSTFDRITSNAAKQAWGRHANAD